MENFDGTRVRLNWFRGAPDVDPLKKRDETRRGSGRVTVQTIGINSSSRNNTATRPSQHTDKTRYLHNDHWRRLFTRPIWWLAFNRGTVGSPPMHPSCSGATRFAFFLGGRRRRILVYGPVEGFRTHTHLTVVNIYPLIKPGYASQNCCWHNQFIGL